MNDPLGPDHVYTAEDASGDQLLLTKMWGSSNQLRFTSASAANLDSQQLADIRFPEPAVCSIFLQSSITSGSGAVSVLNFELIVGLGRTVTTRVFTYPAQPVIGIALDVIVPQQPISSLQARVFGFGTSFVVGQELVVTNVIEVAPFTRIDYKSDPLTFGMAEPGEADGLDDDLRDELEAEAPTVREMLYNEQAQVAGLQVQGYELEPAPEPRDDQARALINYVTQTLTSRHGRAPSSQEVLRALEHVSGRQRRGRYRR
jgi:hypothetical protein